MKTQLLVLLLLIAIRSHSQRGFSIANGNHSRSYLAYSPKERYIDGASAFMVLHKNGETAFQTFGSRQLWDDLSKPAWLIFPSAFKQTWNCNLVSTDTIPSDPAFITAIIETLQNHFAVNQANVYVLYHEQHECLVARLRVDNPLVTFIKISAQNDFRPSSAFLIEQTNTGVTTSVPQHHAVTNTTYFRSKEDSLNFIKGKLLPRYDFRLGTQAPLQMFGTLEVSLFNNGMLSFGYGQLFKPYMNLIFTRLKRRPGADFTKVDFLYNRYDGGRIWSIGAKVNYKRFYSGATMQFLKIGFKATPQTLVQTLAPEKADEIENKIDNSGYRRIRTYYETQVIRPAVYNTQAGLILGYRLPLSFAPRISISLEAAYNITIFSKGKMDTTGGLLSNALNRIVQGEINERLTDKFVGSQIPSFSLSFGYSFGYR